MVSPLSGLNLQAPQDQTLNSVLSGRRSYEQSQLNQQALRQGEQQIGRAEYDQAVQRLGVINRLAQKAKSLTGDQRYAFVQSINPEMLKSVGIDPAQISSVQLDDNSLDALIAQTSAALPKATGEAASFNEMTSGLSADEREKARRVALGLDPRAQGSAAMTIADRGLTGTVGASQAEIERQKALATGGVELALSPEQKRREAQAEADVKLATQPAITSATDTAANKADAAAKEAAAQKKNARALAVYEQGIGSVRDALEGVNTGYIAGKLPAVTEKQQTAEGALAAMAPVLKDLFREAGEGTFTKEDQQILMNMLPTRSDGPGARAAKIKNVDALVKVKLQGGSGQGGSTPGINSNTSDTVSWDSLE